MGNVRGEDGLNKQRAQVVGNELYLATARSMNSLNAIGRIKLRHVSKNLHRLPFADDAR